jgi:signal peptidase II
VFNYGYWITAIVVLAIDQSTKYLAITYLKGQPSLVFWEGVLQFTYATNDGAAFSFFTGQVDWLKWISFAVSGVLIALGFVYKRWHLLEQIGYGFILGGAMGNGIDRFAYGFVVDFLELKLFRFPIFNVADVSINLGLVCLIYVVWRDHDR